MTKSKSGKRDLYESFKVSNVTFSLGDSIEVRADGDSGDMYGRILEIENHPKRGVEVLVEWYYKPEDTKVGRLEWQGVQELLQSDHVDRIHYMTIKNKITVLTLDDFWDLEEVDASTYFCRTKYDIESHEISAENPTDVAKICYCQLPSNPDLTIIACDQCSRWFHAKCLGTGEDVPDGTHFRCKDCKE